MATYKVLQDIEAEDKLVGPLTLRQFIYAGVSAGFLYLTFLVMSKGAPLVAVVFFPIGIISGFFAWPWSRDQPTEVWALAKFRFLLKPRKRIWDQSGMRELVTITAPRKIERALTNGLTQTEVRSRLRALSDTIDSRGWAIKNVNVNMADRQSMNAISDRLVSTSSLPQPVESIDVRPADDMLDVQNNPVAAQFDTMIAASAKAHRQEIIEKMKDPIAPAPQPVAAPAALPIAPPAAPQPLQQPKNDYWFLNQPTGAVPTSVPQDTVTFNTQVVAPGSSVSDLPVAAANPTADEESFIKKLKAEPAFSPNMHGHLHVIQPLSAQTAQAPMPTAPAPQYPQGAQLGQATAPLQNNIPIAPTPPVTPGPDPVTLDLVRNDDLDVATIAREAQRRKEPPQDEVVISLH
ncbi:MAG: PrgI family mobile element protein [Candidatus Saccharimonadales bacterium]